MTHGDLRTGAVVELRPHPHSPWERWTVGQLMPHVAELERDMLVEEVRRCVSGAMVPPAAREDEPLLAQPKKALDAI